MHWRLFATLSEAAGADTVEVEVDGDATVADALDALVAVAPGVEDRIYDANGDLYDHVRLMKNGRSVFADSEGLATPVAADDELALMPAVSGG